MRRNPGHPLHRARIWRYRDVYLRERPLTTCGKSTNSFKARKVRQVGFAPDRSKILKLLQKPNSGLKYFPTMSILLVSTRRGVHCSKGLSAQTQPEPGKSPPCFVSKAHLKELNVRSNVAAGGKAGSTRAHRDAACRPRGKPQASSHYAED